MSISCPECATEMPDAATFCPGCGRSISGAIVSEMVSEMVPEDVSEEILIERAHGNVGALPRRIAGALAYFTVIAAIIFLLVEPFKNDRFVRFHSFQSIGIFLAACGSAIVLRIVGSLLGFIPTLGPLLMVLLWIIVVLGFFLLWMVLVVKTLQGEMFKPPLLGDRAEQFAAN
jgi:uncharacterized membrane protein